MMKRGYLKTNQENFRRPSLEKPNISEPAAVFVDEQVLPPKPLSAFLKFANDVS